MSQIHELETPRLRLRQWTKADKAPFAKLNADGRVMEYFPSALSRSQSDGLVDRLAGAIAQRGWGFWAVEVKNKHPFIGMVGISIPRTQLPFSSPSNPCVEVGWRLDAPYWGYGYATEAAKTAVAFGFETLGLVEIVSFTALGNVRSQAVMERLGMARDLQTFNYPGLAGSPLEEHCLYRISRDDTKSG
ncbi:MAG: GNAT family N-acetyltransferase [Cyanobacteria bacterium J06598_3]